MTPSRKFCLEGQWIVWNTYTNTSNCDKRDLYLFNDLLVEAKPIKKGKKGCPPLLCWMLTLWVQVLLPGCPSSNTLITYTVFTLFPAMKVPTVHIKISYLFANWYLCVWCSGRRSQILHSFVDRWRRTHGQDIFQRQSWKGKVASRAQKYTERVKKH